MRSEGRNVPFLLSFLLITHHHSYSSSLIATHHHSSSRITLPHPSPTPPTHPPTHHPPETATAASVEAAVSGELASSNNLQKWPCHDFHSLYTAKSLPQVRCLSRPSTPPLLSLPPSSHSSSLLPRLPLTLHCQITATGSLSLTPLHPSPLVSSLIFSLLFLTATTSTPSTLPNHCHRYRHSLYVVSLLKPSTPHPLHSI
jgi:hypothetical protein